MKPRKRKTKYYTFLLIPDNERQTKSFKIKSSLLRLLIFSIVMVVFAIVFGFVSYLKFAGVLIDYSNLRKENTQLKNGLSKIEQLKTDLEMIKKSDKKLRTSLTGYVDVAKSEEDQVNSDAIHDLDFPDGRRLERSIYNSIPDIYPVEGFVTRGFETSSSLQEAHMALDIAGAKGSPVKATADGLIIFSGWTYEEGYVIIIKHKFDYYSFYKHNLRNLCSELEYVKKGQVIALLGDSGQISSGAHLHFEIWKGAKPINPEKLLRKRR